MFLERLHTLINTWAGRVVPLPRRTDRLNAPAADRTAAVRSAAGLALLILIGLAAFLFVRGRGLDLTIAADSPIQAGYGDGSTAGVGLERSTRTNAGTPIIEIPSGFYDFGAVGAKAVVRRDFLVVNRGSGLLLIHNAYTTCGCTTADISASQILPGQAARVTVVFDAGAHNMAGVTVRRGLILQTNDPERPEVEIWVQAEVR